MTKKAQEPWSYIKNVENHNLMLIVYVPQLTDLKCH